MVVEVGGNSFSNLLLLKSVEIAFQLSNDGDPTAKHLKSRQEK